MQGRYVCVCINGKAQNSSLGPMASASFDLYVIRNQTVREEEAWVREAGLDHQSPFLCESALLGLARVWVSTLPALLCWPQSDSGEVLIVTFVHSTEHRDHRCVVFFHPLLSPACLFVFAASVSLTLFGHFFTQLHNALWSGNDNGNKTVEYLPKN